MGMEEGVGVLSAGVFLIGGLSLPVMPAVGPPPTPESEAGSLFNIVLISSESEFFETLESSGFWYHFSRIGGTCLFISLGPLILMRPVVVVSVGEVMLGCSWYADIGCGAF